MSGCLLCLHLDLGLKTGFEFKVEVVFVNRDPFDQPPDHPFIVIRHRFLMLIQKFFELVQPLFHGCAVGVLHQKVLLLFPECIDLDSHRREEVMNRIKELQDFISKQKTDIIEFDEALVKKLIEKITVFADHFTVEFKSGIIIDIEAYTKEKRQP